MTARSRDGRRRTLRAAVLAAAVSGLPSTVVALLERDDPLAPTRAAGRLIAPGEARTGPLVLAAGVVHGALSLGWTAVIARTLPVGTGRVRAAAHGALLGAAIAAADLGTAHIARGRRFGAVAELDLAPQVADHVVFGAVAALALRAGRRAGSGPRLS